MALHPALKALADGMSGGDSKPTHELSPAEAREGYRGIPGLFGPPEEVGRVEDHRVPGPAGPIPVRVYTPADASTSLGVLVFYHGGGWVIGDLDTHDRECRALCREGGLLVASVDYRLAPEHPFPAAVDDAFAALQWIGAHVGEWGGDPARIAVGGDSAGGNLAAVVALLARDAGGPTLRFQCLVYPAVDQRDPSPHASRESNAAGPFLLKESMEYFSGHYVPPGANREDPRLSPLLADSHAGLPPALVATAEFDPLRDEGERYADALEKAGVPVERQCYEGMAHLFFQLSPMLEEGRALLSQCARAVREALRP